MDTLIVREEDGHIKTKIYRKKTHTDQYLNFHSHHPLHQKMGVVRSLLDRCYSLVTTKEDVKEEEEHIKGALERCGYPQWTIEETKKKIKEKEVTTTKKANNRNRTNSREW